MKIRTGFVSNSSSSSFVIVGKEYSKHKFEEILFKHLNEDQVAKYEEDPYWFCEDKDFGKLFPGIDVVYDGEGDTVYMGEIPQADKETKSRVCKALSKFDDTVTSKQIRLTSEVLYN